MDLKPYYCHRGYNFLETLPKHPFIKKRIRDAFPVRQLDKRNGVFIDGPIAGFQRLFDGAFVTEARRRIVV